MAALGKLILLALLLISPVLADEHGSSSEQPANQEMPSNTGEMHQAAQAEHGSSLPPIWLVAPFIILLAMIATGPLFYPHLWEHHYPKIAMSLGAFVAVYYAFLMDHGVLSLLHTLEEYISFIALLTALFVASGGILLKFNSRGKPWVNGLILFGGAILSNFIGTTGASMLLIRPFMRLNEGRLKAFHIVFFIFIVSNIGGGLTPIGDPPLFLGFLKGVPFFWVIGHVWHIWLVTVLAVIGVFMLFDRRIPSGNVEPKAGKTLEIHGGKNFIYLGIVIISVFMDPAVISGFPSLQEIFHVPFGIREVIMFSVAFLAYKTGDKEALRGNEFNFEPIKEVAYLFVGIFATMIPALQLIGAYAREHAAEFTVTRFYWFTGALSGVLDNAPTYLNFLAGSMGKFGLDIGSISDVHEFEIGLASPVAGDSGSIIYLMAISVAAVFFGAMTYIGNAPNFMVKNIAEQAGVDVPSFLGYVFKYSIPILLPIFFIVWWVFFNL
ncbi:MAG: sodium:proton antiporter [Candidatus Marinimicrobia bacterium]|nr:sodium:proton antiporter [Candidatus Neomarinimicrobiota bacterium]MCF7921264.1 sodium:proton antiporter [Candidatus Neomarinimicrobiota bacterium]